MTARWHVGMLVMALAIVPTYRLASQDTIPAGFGSLKRDEIVVRFATATIEIQVLPLDESIIRLLAPDTYLSLSGLVRSRTAEIHEIAQRTALEQPTLILITFLGLVPQARFNPEDISLTSRGRLFRPAAIVPISSTWGSYQLEARQQAAAIYLFERGISFGETLTVSYQGMSSEAWSRATRLLDQERARVRARAQAAQLPPGGGS